MRSVPITWPEGWALLLTATLLLGTYGCGDDENHPTIPEGSSCIDCHGDEASLRATADPDDGEPPEDTGEG